jgi:hypothetical protein
LLIVFKIPYGAYKQKTAEDWLLGLTMPNPEVVNDNIRTVHENEMHSAFWESVELTEKDYKVRAIIPLSGSRPVVVVVVVVVEFK